MFKSLSKSPTEDADLDYLIKIDELYNLFKSCFYNDPDTLEEFLNYICLINKEIGINYKNENYLGKSWYHHAIDLAGESENGVMKVIDWLTLNEFNSNLEDSEGQTSLLYCSQKIFNFQNKSSDFSNSYSQICVRMLERNSSIWFKDHRNKSALYYLILSNRCLDKVKEAVNNSGLEECREEFYHIFQNCFKLQPSKSDNSQENNTKLRNNFKVLEFLIDNNPNLRKVIFKEKFQGYSWYHFAIKLADEQNQSTLVLDVIQWLEKKGFNCQIKDSNKRTPLLYCAEKMSRSKKKNPTYSTIFIKLLAMDSEFLIKDKNGKSALQYLLLSNNYATILKDIISQLTLVDFIYGSSTLLSHCFARYCKKDFVMKAFLHKLKTLFEKSEARLSTILNETDNDGCIPLILAISNRYLEDSTKLLLLDMTGICKELFLDFCNQDFHYKHNAIYAKLIEKILANKDLKEDYLQNNVHCDSKKTPLHFLCAKCDNKHLGIIKCLVGNHSQKIDFNAKDINGQTAIFQVKNSEVMEYLLKENKFDLWLQDNNGKNLLHHYCGKTYCNAKVVEMIINQSSNGNAQSQSIINISDNNKNLPFFYAKNKGQTNKVLNLLRTKEMNLEKWDKEVLDTIKKGDLNSIQRLKAKMLDEKHPNFEEFISFRTKQTILHATMQAYPQWEVKTRNEVLKFIMEEFKDDLRKHITLKDKDEKVLLHYIAEDLDLTCCFFEILKNLGCDYFVDQYDVSNGCNLEQKTPVHYAIQRRNIFLLKKLGSEHIDLCANDESCLNYLHYFCIHYCKDTFDSQHFKDFINKCCKNDISKSFEKLCRLNKSPLIYALENENVDEVFLKHILSYCEAKHLISCKSSCGYALQECDSKSETPFVKAIKSKDTFKLDCILKQLSILLATEEAQSISWCYKENFIYLLIKYGSTKQMEEFLKLIHKKHFNHVWSKAKEKLCQDNDDNVVFQNQDSCRMAFVIADYFSCQLTISQLKQTEKNQLRDQLQEEILCKRLLEGIRKAGFGLYDDSEFILKPFVYKGEELLKKILQKYPDITASEFITKISKLGRKDITLHLESFEKKKLDQLNTDQRSQLTFRLGTESSGSPNEPLIFCDPFGLSEQSMTTPFNLIEKKHPSERMLEYLQKQAPDLTLEKIYKLLLDLQECKLAAMTVAKIVFKRIDVSGK